jgi:hypothetical protein
MRKELNNEILTQEAALLAELKKASETTTAKCHK